MTKELQLKESGHVLLTERDLQLLTLIYDHGLMSLGQVERYVFAGKSWPTILNRLQKLEICGYLTRVRVSRLRATADQKNVGVLLRPTQKGISELAKQYPEKTFFEAIPDIRLAQLDHDLLLVDVIERLKKEHPTAGFVEGRRFVRGKEEIHRVPDSVVVDPDSSSATAIELELTAKSEKRYRQIVLGYRLSRHFDKVLFVTASDALTRKIKSEIVGYKVQDAQAVETGNFHFRNITELLRNTKNAA